MRCWGAGAPQEARQDLAGPARRGPLASCPRHRSCHPTHQQGQGTDDTHEGTKAQAPWEKRAVWGGQTYIISFTLTTNFVR